MENLLINEISEFCSEVEKYMCSTSFSRKFKKDLLHFVMYLTASDRIIRSEETQFISRYLERSFSEQELADIIQKKNIHSADFEETVPTSLIEISEFEKEQINSVNCKSSFTFSYIRIFKEIGEAIIVCDNNVHEDEIEDFDIYINMMLEHIEEKFGIAITAR